MANLNTKQVANSLLGNAELVYKANLDLPQAMRSQIDHAGLGDPIFVQAGNPDTNPQQVPSVQGLKLSVERSASTPSNGVVGCWAAVDIQNSPNPLPEKLVLMGQFSDPEITLLTNGSQSGTFAPSVLLFLQNDQAGVTTQVRDKTSRMNLPGTSAGNFFSFTTAFYSDVISPGDPHHFTIVLYVERGQTAINGSGSVYSGSKLMEEKDFTVRNGYTVNTPIDQFRFGLGTASGTLYRSSVRLHEFEIWFPR